MTISTPARLPSFRQLRFLVALADELHFGRAAERCRVTQSTLSAGLKELETQLGVVVAERSKRHVFLTEVGAKLAERARRVLSDAEEMVALAAAEGRPLSGVLRIGALPTIGPYIFPKALPELKKHYPDLECVLREDLAEPLVERLSAGQLDAALIAQPFAGDDLVYVELFDDPYLLVCKKTDPLAQRNRITPADLEGRAVLLLEKGHCQHEEALAGGQAPNFTPQRDFAATSFATLVSMVVEGLGVTVLPQLAVDAQTAHWPNVKTIRIEDAPPRNVVLAWRKGSPRSAELETIARFFRADAVLEPDLA